MDEAACRIRDYAEQIEANDRLRSMSLSVERTLELESQLAALRAWLVNVLADCHDCPSCGAFKPERAGLGHEAGCSAVILRDATAAPRPARHASATGGDEVSPLFRKKPVVIEAFQMTRERRGDNSEWPEWLNRAWNKSRGDDGAVSCRDWPHSDGTDPLVIRTLEGVHYVDWNDWIIQGVKGELYPCKPDIFEATYEPSGPTEAAPKETP
jgi:hypothetical protein